MFFGKTEGYIVELPKNPKSTQAHTLQWCMPCNRELLICIHERKDLEVMLGEVFMLDLNVSALLQSKTPSRGLHRDSSVTESGNG